MSVQLDNSEFNTIRERFCRACQHCECVKPPLAHHCRRCGRCVMRMDHHCPWVSNCIGLKNIKFFILFNFYTMLLTTFNMLDYIINVIVSYMKKENILDHRLKYKFNTILLVGNGVLTFIFLLFSISLFYNQITMIKD